MKRLLLVLLIGACASPGGPAADVAAHLDAPALGAMADEPGVVDYAMVLPENVVWVPWKIVGGTIKGVADGVSAGFDPERLPLVGLIVSPLNAGLGAVTGLVNGLVMSPVLVGPSDSFGDAMGRPMTQKTPIFWY